MKNIPLYAVIPLTGKEYTVVFKAEENTSGCYTTGQERGYGSTLPAKLPADLPVIVYWNNDKVWDALKLTDEQRPYDEYPRTHQNTLDGYLSLIRNLGIEVITAREYHYKYEDR